MNLEESFSRILYYSNIPLSSIAVNVAFISNAFDIYSAPIVPISLPLNNEKRVATYYD
jgi:hypothetical protein